MPSLHSKSVFHPFFCYQAQEHTQTQESAKFIESNYFCQNQGWLLTRGPKTSLNNNLKTENESLKNQYYPLFRSIYVTNYSYKMSFKKDYLSK